MSNSSPDDPPAAKPSVEELIARGDAIYRPFRPFADWKALEVDDAQWSAATTALDKLRTSPALPKALEVVKRAAAIDTGALENLYETDLGFTLTVAARIGSWEQLLGSRSEETQRRIEDQISAHDRLIDLVKQDQPLTEAAIRELHRVICRSQETYEVRVPVGDNVLLDHRPLPKGQYKLSPNHVLRPADEILAFAPVMETPAEMHRLVEELRSAEFAVAHPSLQAAFAHYAFVTVHPFADGNGRMARLIASFFLWRRHGVPLLIFASERSEYLAALRMADRGELQEWVAFVERHGRDAIRLVTENMALAKHPRLGDAVAALRGLYHTRGQFQHEQIDKTAQALLRAYQDEFSHQLNPLKDGTLAVWEIQEQAGAAFPTLPHTRPVADGYGHFVYNLQTMPPAQAQVHGRVQVEIPKNARAEDEFVIVWKQTLPEAQPEVLFQMQVAEATEGIGPAWTVSIGMNVEALLARIVANLSTLAEAERNRRGYT